MGLHYNLLKKQPGNRCKILMNRQTINDDDYIQYLIALHTVEGAYATVASLFQAVWFKKLTH
jgi:hypothetical protein